MIIYEARNFFFWTIIAASWWLFSVCSTLLFIVHSFVCVCMQVLYCGSIVCSFFSWQAFRLLAVAQWWLQFSGVHLNVRWEAEECNNLEWVIQQQLSHAHTVTKTATVLCQCSCVHYNLAALPNKNWKPVTYTQKYSSPLQLSHHHGLSVPAEHDRRGFGRWCWDGTLPRDLHSLVWLCNHRTVPLASAAIRHQLHNQAFIGRGGEEGSHMFVPCVR